MGRDARGPAGLAQQLRDLPQNFVADRLVEPVLDALEVIGNADHDLIILQSLLLGSGTRLLDRMAHLDLLAT